MKSELLQNLVLSKYQNGEGPSKIFRDLKGSLSLRTVERWCRMIKETGSIKFSYSPGRPRTAHTKINIQKVKTRLKRKKRLSSRKLSTELGISRSSARRILTTDLRCLPYKKITEPLLTDDHKAKRKKFANWVKSNFRKEQTMKILFSDEKMFDIDGAYNAQNDRIWAVNRTEADKNGGIQQKRRFSQKFMVWLGVCSKGITPLIIFEKGTVNHERYVNKVLPVALKYGNNTFGDNWIYQQDGATSHTHHLTQQWCRDNFPNFIDKDHWPPNSPDLNPLGYSIWNELVKAIKWNKVNSKVTLIKQLKCAVKKISNKVVFESCDSWSKRLYRLSKNNFNYLH